MKVDPNCHTVASCLKLSSGEKLATKVIIPQGYTSDTKLRLSIERLRPKKNTKLLNIELTLKELDMAANLLPAILDLLNNKAGLSHWIRDAEMKATNDENNSLK